MLSEHCVSEDFRRLPKHVKVALKWRGDRTTRLGVLGNGGLIHNSIGAEGVGRLASVLGVTHLDLSANKIGAGGTDSLAVALRRCKALADLCLGHNRIGVRGVGKGVRRLADVLGECRALDYLDLNANEIGEEGAGWLSNALGKCKDLAHLFLGHNSIGAVVGWLAGVLGQCKALAYLDLSANTLGAEGVRWLAGALAKRKALYHLNVDCNASGPEGPG
eukprot:3938115-Rhodomonas_salina.4